MDSTKGIRLEGISIECIRFADDMVLLAENEKALQEMSENLSKGLSSRGMKINKKKTKVMAIGTSPKRINIKIENCEIEQVSSFRSLGSLL